MYKDSIFARNFLKTLKIILNLIFKWLFYKILEIEQDC